MNTDQLTYLIEVSKNSSMAAASKSLHITPQALSTAIKKLEEELGFDVLNRSYKGISLTADGEWLVEEAALFLDKIAQRQKRYQESSVEHQHSGDLQVYFNYSGINNSIFGQLICNLYQSDPDLHVQLEETSKNTILEEVLNHKQHFGIIFRTTFNNAYSDNWDNNLIFEPLFDGELTIMTAPDSELAKFNSISLKKLTQYPLCNYYTYQEEFTQLEKFFSDMLNLSVRFSTENNYSIYQEKILRGIANACTLKFSVEEHPANYVEGTKTLALRENIKSYFGLVYHKDTVLDDNEQYFIQELKKLIKERLDNKAAGGC